MQHGNRIASPTPTRAPCATARASGAAPDKVLRVEDRVHRLRAVQLRVPHPAELQRLARAHVARVRDVRARVADVVVKEHLDQVGVLRVVEQKLPRARELIAALPKVVVVAYRERAVHRGAAARHPGAGAAAVCKNHRHLLTRVRPEEWWRSAGQRATHRQRRPCALAPRAAPRIGEMHGGCPGNHARPRRRSLPPWLPAPCATCGPLRARGHPRPAPAACLPACGPTCAPSRTGVRPALAVAPSQRTRTESSERSVQHRSR